MKLITCDLVHSDLDSGGNEGEPTADRLQGRNVFGGDVCPDQTKVRERGGTTGIGEVGRVSASVGIPMSGLNGVLADEGPGGRLVVPGPVVVEPALGVILAGRVGERVGHCHLWAGRHTKRV